MKYINVYTLTKTTLGDYGTCRASSRAEAQAKHPECQVDFYERVRATQNERKEAHYANADIRFWNPSGVRG